jgi:O-antigen/teichoic acid export membrane protein
MASDSSYRSIAKNITVFGGVEALSVLGNLIRNKFVALWIGTAGIGLSYLYWTLATFFSNLSSLGLATSGVKTLSEAYASGDRTQLSESIARLRTMGLWTAVAGAAITAVAAPLYARINDFDGALHFTLIAFIVLATIVYGIEMAVMKACRQTRRIALSTAILALCSVLIPAPFYYFWRMDGIIWALVVSQLVNMSQSLWFGHRTEPYRLVRNETLRQLFEALKPTIMLGIAFIAAGIFSSGVELAIQSYFTTFATLSVLGLYRAGFQLSISYTGMIFTAVNADFYPRLATVNQNVRERNILIRRQARVQLLFALAVVVLFEMVVPWLLPLLFSDAFVSVIPMARWAMLSVLPRALALPLCFLPLALGKSFHYLLLESLSWAMLGGCVVIGYELGGLEGTGIAILLSQTAELLILYLFCKIKYKFSIQESYQ